MHSYHTCSNSSSHDLVWFGFNVFFLMFCIMRPHMCAQGRPQEVQEIQEEGKNTHRVCFKLVPAGSMVALIPCPEEAARRSLWKMNQKHYKRNLTGPASRGEVVVISINIMTQLSSH